MESGRQRVDVGDDGIRIRYAALPDLRVAIVIRCTDATRSPSAWHASGPSAASGDVQGLGIVVSWTYAADAIQLRVRLHNQSDRAVSLQTCETSVRGLDAWWKPPVSPRALKVAWCGAHSRSPASRSSTEALTRGVELESWWVGAISGAEGPSIVLGGLAFERFVSRVVVTLDACRVEQPLEAWHLAPGEALDVDPLHLALATGAAYGSLEAYARAVALASRAQPRPPVCGWGSWGHWSERIDAGLMHEMVMGLDGSSLLRKHVQLVQVDDGWSELLDSQRVSTSWRANARFPSGIAPLADVVVRSGRTFGLWLLPFTVNAGAALLETHPDWLIQGADGAPAPVGGGGSYCIDPTHPGAARWLRTLLGDLRTRGVGYVKLDFLRGLLAPDPTTGIDAFDTPRRHVGARTRLEAYRAGLDLVRDALGSDVTILACSSPLGATAGLADAQRIGPDIEPGWEGRLSGIRDAARSAAANWFWHGQTWTNDADYLLVCESEGLTRFWASIIALSGGAVVLSADLVTLPAWAERLFAFVLPPTGQAARPTDLFAAEDGPSQFALACTRGSASWHMVALVNWSERPRRIQFAGRLDAAGAAHHVWDAWRQQHRIVSGPVSSIVEPHAVAMLRVTPVVAQPTLVGTDVHWAQGWHEFASLHFDVAGNALHIRVADDCPREGCAWIWVPPDWEVVSGATPTAEGLATISLSPGAAITSIFRSAP
jgi:hypothetical protein